MGLEKLVVQKEEVQLATVVEVITGQGVKLKIDGESTARETYYNSLVVPQVTDRVYYIKTGGTLLVLGVLKF